MPRLFPSLHGYHRPWLRSDVVAGLTVSYASPWRRFRCPGYLRDSRRVGRPARGQRVAAWAFSCRAAGVRVASWRHASRGGRMESPPVLVVGAGPTGLAVACGLRLHGVSVRVLDRATGPAVTSRALGLQPRGAEVLDRLG